MWTKLIHSNTVVKYIKQYTHNKIRGEGMNKRKNKQTLKLKEKLKNISEENPSKALNSNGSEDIVFLFFYSECMKCPQLI